MIPAGMCFVTLHLFVAGFVGLLQLRACMPGVWLQRNCFLFQIVPIYYYYYYYFVYCFFLKQKKKTKDK